MNDNKNNINDDLGFQDDDLELSDASLDYTDEPEGHEGVFDDELVDDGLADDNGASPEESDSDIDAGIESEMLGLAENDENDDSGDPANPNAKNKLLIPVVAIIAVSIMGLSAYRILSGDSNTGSSAATTEQAQSYRTPDTSVDDDFSMSAELPKMPSQIASISVAQEPSSALPVPANPISTDVLPPTSPASVAIAFGEPGTTQSEIDKLAEEMNSALSSISAEIKGNGKNLANYVAQTDNRIESLQSDFKALSESLVGLKNETVKTSSVSIEAPQAQVEISVDIISALKGRKRLHGFSVINSSSDGTNSIVLTPNGRVNVYFKGERFRSGDRTFVVEDILESGRLVLVGSDYFIDNERIEPQQSVIPAAKDSGASKPAKPDSGLEKAVKDLQTKVELLRGGQDYDVRANSKFPGRVGSDAKVAAGWTMNAVFLSESGGETYLVKRPSGTGSPEFLSISKGETIKGLGVVHGQNLQGDLHVGDFIISKEN